MALETSQISVIYFNLKHNYSGYGILSILRHFDSASILGFGSSKNIPDDDFESEVRRSWIMYIRDEFIKQWYPKKITRNN